MKQFNKNEQLKVKVYLATDANRQKLTDKDHIFTSIDKEYLVVYSKEDMAHLEYLMAWDYNNDVYHDFMLSGVEEQMYYRMLQSAKVIHFIPGEYIGRIADVAEAVTVLKVDHENYITYYFINKNEDIINGQYSFVYLSKFEGQQNGRASYKYLARREK